MFVTPERSENIPPIAAKTSGVANRSVDAISADQTTTVSSLPTPDSVARYPTVKPSTPDAIAKPPNRRSPRMMTPMPNITATRHTTRLHTHDRAVTGGSAIQQPTRPRTMPVQATARRPRGARAASGRAIEVMRASFDGRGTSTRARSRRHRRRERRGPGSGASGSRRARVGRSPGRGCGSRFP
jgi:hypothetical protein